MAVLSRGRKLNVSFLMEHELQRLPRDCLFYRAFPLSLSTRSLCLSASRARQVKAGVYRNSRQAGPCHTAEQHRNVLYALERQDSWGEIVRQLPQTCIWCAERHVIHSPARKGSQFCVTLWFRRRAAARQAWFGAVKQESHTRTHKWAAEESLRLPVSAAALKAHTVNWGFGFGENPEWTLILISGKSTF